MADYMKTDKWAKSQAKGMADYMKTDKWANSQAKGMAAYMQTDGWLEAARRATRKYAPTEKRQKTRQEYELTKKAKLRNQKYKRNNTWYKKAVKKAIATPSLNDKLNVSMDIYGEEKGDDDKNKESGADPKLFNRDAMSLIRSHVVSIM